MNRKKAYVSPQVMRVKLEPTQAVLTHCSVTMTKIKDSFGAGMCTTQHGGCKQLNGAGDDHASS